MPGIALVVAQDGEGAQGAAIHHVWQVVLQWAGDVQHACGSGSLAICHPTSAAQAHKPAASQATRAAHLLLLKLHDFDGPAWGWYHALQVGGPVSIVLHGEAGGLRCGGSGIRTWRLSTREKLPGWEVGTANRRVAGAACWHRTCSAYWLPHSSVMTAIQLLL